MYSYQPKIDTSVSVSLGDNTVTEMIVLLLLMRNMYCVFYFTR